MSSHETRSLMILGTSSGVGKTLVTLAICRWISLQGIKVTPFKTMSMQLGRNSYQTMLGGEIHVHQAHQARAANVEPHVDMNPIVLRQIDDQLEVLVLGYLSTEITEAVDECRIQLIRSVITEAYTRLAQQYEFIVTEGCGSPVELNIKERDVTNMWVAETFDVPCILVSSIEHTGVFASIVGTLSLLNEQEKARIVGFIINKFHGPSDSFSDGIRILEEKTGLPCLGIIPFLPDIQLLGKEISDRSISNAIMSSKAFNDELDRWANHVITHLDCHFLKRYLLYQGDMARSTTL